MRAYSWACLAWNQQKNEVEDIWLNDNSKNALFFNCTFG